MDSATVSRRFALAPIARAAAACALLGTSMAIARGEFLPVRDVLAEHQVELVRGSLQWLDPNGMHARRGLLLARRHEQLTDVYAVTARTDAHDQIIELLDLSNLTRSPDAEESSLTVSGPFAVYAARSEGAVIAFTLLDIRGEHGLQSVRGGAKFRGEITRWQQTGQSRGYNIDRFELAHPARSVQFTWEGTRLTVIADGARIEVDASGPRLVAGEAFVRERPRLSAVTDNWVTWAVDTVRAIPWVGAAPIAWAEGVAFRAQHVARRASAAVSRRSTAAAAQEEVAEDLADVLAIHATGSHEGVVRGWPPPPMQPIIDPPIEHEGEWSPVARDDDPFVQSNPGAPEAMYISYLRTDRELDDARAYVLLWDPRQIELHVAPGSQEPIGATGETGSGVIPRDESTLTRLVGAFNGAFQGLHGEYGVYAEGELLLPPKPYAATVAALADGSTALGSWPGDEHAIPAAVVEFRQNLTALVDNGELNPWHREDWGPVLNNPADLRTARTGICRTHEGFMAFFWGNDLNPRGLGESMLAARCAYGMHLDMNGANTGFDFYRVAHAGHLPRLDHRIQSGFEAEGTVDEMPGLQYRARRLVRGMQHQASRYIHRNPRDFFYMLLRPVLPGPAIAPVVTPAVAGEGTFHVAGLTDLPFPWPMARTRIRPDPRQPDHWVNLARIDPRRVALAPGDATDHVVARIAGGTAQTDPGPLRLTMTEGAAGVHWSIGTEGTGLEVEPLAPGSSAIRGACVDTNGFLVLAVADRALPDLVARALDRAGCDGTKVAVHGAVWTLANGDTVTGETATGAAPPALALVSREFPLAQSLFPDVAPVPRQVWYPVQSRRVRYFPNPGNTVTVQVRLAGQQQPTVFRLAGIGARFVQQAYPDGGAPPEITGAN